MRNTRGPIATRRIRVIGVLATAGLLAVPLAASAAEVTVPVPVPGQPCTVTVGTTFDTGSTPPATAYGSTTCKV